MTTPDGDSEGEARERERRLSSPECKRPKRPPFTCYWLSSMCFCSPEDEVNKALSEPEIKVCKTWLSRSRPRPRRTCKQEQ